MNCTLVTVIDAEHLEQLRMTAPTWVKNKPAILKMRKVLVYDAEQLTEKDARRVFHADKYIPWHGNDKYVSQRHKMLSAFCFVPAEHVYTPYFLKLDTDTVAYPHDSEFPDPEWFEGDPAMVAKGWSYTKPANAMLDLDEWADSTQNFKGTEPLRSLGVRSTGRTSLFVLQRLATIQRCRFRAKITCFGIRPLGGICLSSG
jgi:hypothetical protein